MNIQQRSVEDRKMLKILETAKPSRRCVLPVYNGVHIFTAVRKYIYIREKRDENTWLLNILICGQAVPNVSYTLTFHHCHVRVRGVCDEDMDLRYGSFCSYDIRLFVELCVRNFTKGEIVVEFTKQNGFLYSLNFIATIKCRVEEWRAIMGC
jgi:hypothetical protein